MTHPEGETTMTDTTELRCPRCHTKPPSPLRARSEAP